MEALIAFYFGWTMGSRSGPQGVEELTEAISSLRQSKEFAEVVVALRKHAAGIVRDVAGHIEGTPGESVGGSEVLAAVYSLIFPEGTDKTAE